MDFPRSWFVHSPLQDAWQPSTERTISSAISSSSTSHQGRNAEEDFQFVEGPPNDEHCIRDLWNLLSALAAQSPIISTEHNNWPPYPDHPASDWEEAASEATTAISKDLYSAPSSQELPPLHLRSNHNRPRLLLFNHLSKLWLPLRQDRFLVLLTYLLGGTELGMCRGIPWSLTIQCRHVPRTVPYV